MVRIQQGKSCESTFVNSVMLIFVTLVIIVNHLFHAIRNNITILVVGSMSDNLS